MSMGGFIILRLTATCCQYQTSQKLLGIPVSLHPDIELTISIVQRLHENDGGMRGSGLDEGNFQKNPNKRAIYGVWNASLLLVSPVHTLFQPQFIRLR